MPADVVLEGMEVILLLRLGKGAVDGVVDGHGRMVQDVGVVIDRPKDGLFEDLLAVAFEDLLEVEPCAGLFEL